MKRILVLGSLNMDFVIRVKNMPKSGETILAEGVKLVPGGKGANQAYVLGKLGGKATMLGAVGDDIYGQKLIANLEDVQVDVSGVQIIENTPTGQAFVSVYDSGDNSIIVVQGANGKLTKELIDENIHYIDECDYLIMQLEIPLEIVNYVKELALQRGKKVVLDPAPAVSGLEDSFWKGISILKPNETELEILTGEKLETEEEVRKAAEGLIGKGVETVIVTLGEKGCMVVEKNRCLHFPARKVEIVDTTAAGDSFLAALVIAICEDKTLEEAVEFAQLVSSIVVTRQGAQTSIPRREEISLYLNGRENRKN